MKTPVVWVTASLTAAIVVTLTFLIATTSRGEESAFASLTSKRDVQTVRPAWPIRGRWLSCPTEKCR